MLVAGCDTGVPEIYPASAKLVFHNRTDVVFCYDFGRVYDSSTGGVITLPASATRAGRSCGGEIKPDATTVLGPECISGPTSGYQKGLPLDVFLSADGSAPAYSGSARCDEETTFVIRSVEGRFVVEKTITKPLLPDSSN